MKSLRRPSWHRGAALAAAVTVIGSLVAAAPVAAEESTEPTVTSSTTADADVPTETTDTEGSTTGAETAAEDETTDESDAEDGSSGSGAEDADETTGGVDDTDLPEPGSFASPLAGISLLSVADGSHVVNSLGNAADAAIDGVCDTGATVGSSAEPECTLRAALQEVNAAAAGSAPQTITYSVTGTNTVPDATSAMYTGTLGTEWAHVGDGATYLIDAQVPVTVDFTGLDLIEVADFTADAGFYVASDNVTLRNLTNLFAAEAGVVIGGSNVTVDNVNIEDPATSIQETGMSLLDGASDVQIRNLTIFSAWNTSIMVDANATVTNVNVTNVTSRGVEAMSHVALRDGSTVNGFVVNNSTFGAAGETSPSPGFNIGANVTTQGLQFLNSKFLSPNRVFLYLVGGGQTLNSTTVTNSEFTGNSYIVSDNIGTFNDFRFNNNTVTESGVASGFGGLQFGGLVTDMTITGNTFTDVHNGGIGGVTFYGADPVTDVQITNNTFDRFWTNGAIQVSSPATRMLVADNTFTDFEASVSRPVIWINATASDSVVRDNVIAQLDPALQALSYWAIFVEDDASAPDTTSSTGWSIVENEIDGFGSNNNAQAPITNAAQGRTLIVGNTFGPTTRGTTVAEESEVQGFWFLWNVNQLINNKVQTYRAEDAVFDGDEVTFTVAEVDPVLAGNNPATGPVTVHAYWSPADNADEYLGAVTDVTAGSRISLPTGHTDGFIRIQIVDANGFTSQYSALAAPAVAPAPPVVVDDETGTGEPGATIVIRDADGEVVATVDVDQDGNWTIPDLPCGQSYSVTQRIGDGPESGVTTLTSSECPASAGDDDGTGAGDSLLPGTGASGAAAVAGALGGLLLVLGLALVAIRGRVTRS